MTDIDASRPQLPTVSRLTALFQRGKVVKLGEDETGPVLVWMNALTATEREECILDGAVAQARERELNGAGTPTYDAMRAELEKTDRPQIIEALCMTRGAETWALAQDDLHADEKWRGDKLLLVERGDAAIQSGMELSPEERDRLTALNDEYLADWRAHAQKRIEALKAEYNALETRELIAAYLKAWTDTRALKAQADEYRISQLYYSTRACRASEREDGGYDHGACEDHVALVFPDRLTVRRQPDTLLQELIPVADEIDRRGGDALGKQ